MGKALSKSVMVDMSATLLHHGHIRLLKAAHELGRVVIALVTDQEIRAKKGYVPELDFSQRKEMLEAIRYVDEVIPAPWLIDEAFLDLHHIDILIHGSDNTNPIPPHRLIVLERTPGISSSILRIRSLETLTTLLKLETSDP